jgi:UPF0042 nucleotide-binding protein
VVVVSGLSGAGKTAAAKLFEDLGYTVVDNLPGELLPDLAELVSGDRERFARVAIVLDVRAGDAPLAFAAMRGALEGRGIHPQVFFLDARDEILIRRFSETRHRHPLADQRGIASSIAHERRLLAPVQDEADVVLDTSDLSLRELRERIFSHLGDTPEPETLAIQLISFGFKYGVPLEADLVFDVRFMQNPHYIPELRQLSGLTEAVRRYVLDQPVTRRFLTFLDEFLAFVIPAYISEGKTRLTIAIGCTGGYHRSIAIAEALAEHLRKKGLGPVAVFHRELDRA